MDRPTAEGSAAGSPPPAALPDAAASPRGPSAAARLVTFSLVCALLYWARAVAIPVALGVLISFLLNPLVRRFQRARVPRAAAVTVSVLLSCGALAGLIWVLGSQLANLIEELPQHRENITAKVKELRRAMAMGDGTVGRIKASVDTVASDLKQPAEGEQPSGEEQPEPGAGAPADSVKPVPVYMESPPHVFNMEDLSAVPAILAPFASGALVLLLVFFMLLRWEDMRSRLISFSGHRNLTVATKACDDAGRRISRYLLMQFLINGSYGLVLGLGLFFLGVKYAALWGLCAALFRYVPYVGPIVAGALPIVFSLITSPGWQQPLWVAALVVFLELVSNNLLEPWLYGTSLGLSPMGVIIAAVAWTFLWGSAGLVMSTPLTVVLVVMGEYVPAFSIFSRLLGDKPVMEPHFQLYQRLLARDEVETLTLIRELVKQKPLREVLDEVFIPALALAKRDEAAALLEKQDITYITTTAERIFGTFRADAEEKEREEHAEAPPSVALQRASILVWPSGELALTAARFLQWLLRDSAAEVVLLAPQSLAGEVIEAMHTHQPAAVCLLHLSGADATRARQYLRKLKSDGPAVPLIMARLGVSGTLTASVRDSFRGSGASEVTRTLHETAAAILPQAQNHAQLLTPAQSAAP
jgi:predicted PurR-regulated permease PerM